MQKYSGCIKVRRGCTFSFYSAKMLSDYQIKPALRQSFQEFSFFSVYLLQWEEQKPSSHTLLHEKQQPYLACQELSKEADYLEM